MAPSQATIAYDGSGFLGFQRQAQGRTVQAVFEQALRELGWQGPAITYAGRTDTGVHALGQVVAFDLPWKHGPEALRRALNARLPQDVAVWDLREAPTGFHPRYDARARRYVYRLRLSPHRHPILDRYTWRVWPPPDWHRLTQATRLLPGRRDFRSLGTPTREAGHTVRTVFHAAWYEVGPGEWAFDIVADAFLYHMVRRAVAVLVAVGQGRFPLDAWAEALAQPPEAPLQGLAPASGLYLAAVYYGPWTPPSSPEAFRQWWRLRWYGWLEETARGGILPEGA